MSHPTWVRGLKPSTSDDWRFVTKSHPTWVRGLKQKAISKLAFDVSRTLRGCVD